MTGGSTSFPVGFPGPQMGHFPKFEQTPHQGLAITQLVVGVLCVVFNITAIAFNCVLSYSAIGIWGGIVVIVTGVMGIIAVKQKSRCTVISTLVLSIVSSVLAGIIIILFTLGAIIDGLVVYTRTSRTNQVILDSILAVLGLVEVLVAIVQAAFCCKAMSSRYPAVQIVYVSKPPEQVMHQETGQVDTVHSSQPDASPQHGSPLPSLNTDGHLAENHAESNPAQGWVEFED